MSSTLRAAEGPKENIYTWIKRILENLREPSSLYRTLKILCVYPEPSLKKSNCKKSWPAAGAHIS
jgi:hypothetical protein